jgi:hypothetical protein
MSRLPVKFLIACSGKATRWGNYLDTPKQLIPIDGERLVDRTVRLLKERMNLVTDYIHIVAFTPQFASEGATLLVPSCVNEKELEDHYESHFLYVSKKWWSTSGLTTILYGDVYYTEEAMDTIVQKEVTGKKYMFFGRENGSSFTLCKYGELFAISFIPSFHTNLWKVLLQLKRLRVNGKIPRFTAWEIYRTLQDLPINLHKIKDNFVEIDDFTDDFDYPHDYDRWMLQRAIVRHRIAVEACYKNNSSGNTVSSSTEKEEGE